MDKTKIQEFWTKATKEDFKQYKLVVALGAPPLD